MADKCKLSDAVVLMILVGWFGGIILLSLLFRTAGIQEGFAALAFDDVRTGPECCPSSFSTSGGCACLSPDQLATIQSRGGNR